MSIQRRVIIAVLVQPTVGSISDYTISRWGRRKPYILIGSLLDLVFLIGIATSNTLLAVGAFVVLLQFSSNFAQGPFQGYVPDLVPAPQVGLASGLVGLMQVLGVVVRLRDSASIGRRDRRFHDRRSIALGVLELVTMLSLFFRLRRGPGGQVARRSSAGASIATRGVGHATSSRSAASCGSWPRASSSYGRRRLPDHAPRAVPRARAGLDGARRTGAPDHR